MLPDCMDVLKKIKAAVVYVLKFLIAKIKGGLKIFVALLSVMLPVLVFFLPDSFGVLRYLSYVALGYCCIILFWFFCMPISRDRSMAKGNLICYVTTFVFCVLLACYALNLCGVSGQTSGGVSEVGQGLWRDVFLYYVDPGNLAKENLRVSSVILVLLGIVFLNGLFVSIVVSWFDKRRDMWYNGELRYRKWVWWGKVAVVIGANELTASVVKKVFEGFKTKNRLLYSFKYVILLTSSDVSSVRNDLASYLDEEEMRHLVIFKASRDSYLEISKLPLRKISEIYVLGESVVKGGGEPFHDALNIKCVTMIADSIKAYMSSGFCIRKRKSRDKIPCMVMLEYQTTYSMFQVSELPEIISEYLNFVPFNRYENWVQLVLADGVFHDRSHPQESCVNGEIKYTPLDGEGITPDSDDSVHLVVVGMSKMGVAMGMGAVCQAHYPNFIKGVRTRITFIDTNADKEMSFVKGKYDCLFSLMRHRLIDVQSKQKYDSEWIDPIVQRAELDYLKDASGKNFIDVEVEFVKGEIESDGVRRILEEISAPDRTVKLTIAVCLNQTHQALAAAMYMPSCVYSKVQEIWVYQCESADIVLNLYSSKTNADVYRKLRPFGMLYGGYLRDDYAYYGALLANGVYHRMDLGNVTSGDDASLKEFVDKFDKITVYNQWASRCFADSMFQKLRSSGAGLFDCRDVSGSYWQKMFDGVLDNPVDIASKAMADNVDVMARCEHSRWLVHQLLMGISPCTKSEFAEFRHFNDSMKEAYRTGSHEYAQFRERHSEKKAKVKSGVIRRHPDICPYGILDEIDMCIKDNDIRMNRSIPMILKSVYSIMNKRRG